MSPLARCTAVVLFVAMPTGAQKWPVGDRLLQAFDLSPLLPSDAVGIARKLAAEHVCDTLRHAMSGPPVQDDELLRVGDDRLVVLGDAERIAEAERLLRPDPRLVGVRCIAMEMGEVEFEARVLPLLRQGEDAQLRPLSFSYDRSVTIGYRSATGRTGAIADIEGPSAPESRCARMTLSEFEALRGVLQGDGVRERCYLTPHLLSTESFQGGGGPSFGFITDYELVLVPAGKQLVPVGDGVGTGVMCNLGVVRLGGRTRVVFEAVSIAAEGRIEMLLGTGVGKPVRLQLPQLRTKGIAGRVDVGPGEVVVFAVRDATGEVMVLSVEADPDPPDRSGCPAGTEPPGREQ